MIPRDERRDIVSNLPGETQAFTIKASGKAFKVLIDGLYSNKIRSIVRELWTNAFDAHVAAGCPDKPFECTLPSAGLLSSPTFSVRDYGVSMDHETVMTRYSTLFDSSKDGTNTQVGYLGLGSKSPFSYTDSFTVTAWLDGEKRVYVAVLNTDGVPSISLLSRTPSDEPTGLEVSFAASPQDARDFKIAAKQVALGFDVCPLGVEAPADPLFSGPGWKLYERNVLDKPILIRQGCVVYPYTGNLTLGLVPHAILVDVPIGTCDVTASREALSLTPATESAVRRHVDAAVQSVRAYFEAKIEAQPTILAASKLWATDESLRWVAAPTWKGQPLSQSINLGFQATKAKVTGRYSNPYISAVHVTDIDKINVLVDDGTKVIRRRERINAFVSRWDVNRDRTLLLDETTTSTLKGLLELKDDQIRPLVSLPDPGPTPRPTQQRAVPKTPFVWMLKSRDTISFPAFGQGGASNGLVNAVRGVYRNEMKGTDPVEYFTPGQAERLKLSESNRIDVLVSNFIANDPVILAEIDAQNALDQRKTNAQSLMDQFGYSIDHEVKILLVEEVYGVSFGKPVQNVISDSLRQVATALGLLGCNPGSSATLSSASAELRNLKQTYPILFKGREALAKNYINQIKAQSAQKGNGN